MSAAIKKIISSEDESKILLDEKTRELKLAQDELASFSYSVSHDLRAPLRGVLGFTKILLEEYGAKLDDQAHEYLMHISDSGQKMSDLIDGLLNLSSVTRGEIKRKEINLSEIVNGVILEIQKNGTDDRVSFAVEKNIMANGDQKLLTVVLTHLLNNAWKFSSKTNPAHIEFGSLSSTGKTVYFVRDNGVGFEMRFADKLFGAFQKLHSEKEFTGVGIGLAIVQRIVHRHGGRIWAKAAVDQGAMFCFTL